jgi:hypothetical protein
VPFARQNQLKQCVTKHRLCKLSFRHFSPYLHTFTPNTSTMDTIKKILKTLCFCIDTDDELTLPPTKGNGRGISGGSRRAPSMRGPIRLHDATNGSIKSYRPSSYEPYHHDSVRSKHSSIRSNRSTKSAPPQGLSFFAARSPSELEARLNSSF